MKTDAYYIPDGVEIRKRRKILEWLPEDLAKVAVIGVSTVKRSERNLPAQLRILSKIAKALEVPIEVIVPRLRDPNYAQSGRSSIRVFSTWMAIEKIILNASHSLLIIDSYFGEYGRLGLLLGTRARDQARLPLIEVYMASPEMDFGAQRQREANSRPITDAHQQILLLDQLEDSARNSYEAHFHFLAENIRTSATPYSDQINIFEYHCMPSMRIIAIDDLHFFFGWFPLFAQNPNHSCLYLKDANLDKPGSTLLDEVRFQIECVRAVSEPMLDADFRTRLNRRETHHKEPRERI
jgi:transcriptional regulator with XRE-family HTH domain